jgi:hypothetical protein
MDERTAMDKRAENLATLAERFYRGMVEQAKMTAKTADGISDGWQKYLTPEAKKLVEHGEELFGKVE